MHARGGVNAPGARQDAISLCSITASKCAIPKLITSRQAMTDSAQTTNSPTTSATASAVVITADQLLQHWQGHRRLTRKMIEAFPEEALFQFSIGGMRPFSTLVMEMIRMAVPIVRGVATGQWTESDAPEAKARTDMLQLWDQATEDLDRLWPTIPPRRFQEVDTAFGQWKMPGYEMVLYAVDNEIHHRGQGYVYLRSLGVEPPQFWDRS